ncbi:S9 family peptidase [Planococcus salinus]|uniref:S9 family peptidase n=1 Tax=Planococcus salinus TaxID=1848460 RepID=A0A3M8P7U0_9BACL|nr:S9 family peptidase [Planococcus salinus]RNF39491.1 S9 family peptidase [Planococcus salinus]
MTVSTEQLLNTYLHAHGASQPEVIPGKKAFTFLSKETGLPQAWKWEEASSEVVQYTDVEDRVMFVSHSPSGAGTIIGMDEKGNEKQQLYMLTENGEKVEELINSKEHFHNFGGWSPDETKIAYSSNRRDAGYFDVFIMDLETKQEECVYQVDGNCTPVCWTKDGKGLILRIPDTNIELSFYLFDLATKQRTRIGKDQTLARYQSIQLSSDGKEGFVLTDEERDLLGIHHFRLDEPSVLNPLLLNKQWDIEEIKLSPDNSRLAFTVNEGGLSSLGIYDLKEGLHRQVAGLPKGVFSSIDWLSDHELIVDVKSAVLPGDIWKVSLTNGKVERLTFVGESKEVQDLWVEPELCKFASFDELEVPYFLYGKKEESQPVVVYVHGGPESQIRSEYNPVIQFLASQGFAVVAPNVRGSLGYGRKYVKLDDGRKRMDSVADLKALTEDLVKNHGVDADRIGIMGRSYGGFMVLAAVTHYPDIWAAGVDIVGISHFKSFLENTGPWRRKMREFEYGSLQEDVDFFEEIAPLNHTANITAPLLVFHGRNDTRVPVTEAEQLTADLENQGKQVELVIFDDEGHQTEKIENHIRMNTMIVEFMQKNL